MQQQYQILQSLNQCYSQLQQQHQDMAALQQQFHQLFSYNPSSSVSQSNPSPNRPQTVSPNMSTNPSPMFMNLPSNSPLRPPFSAPLSSQAPFTFAYQPPSSAPVFRTAWHPSHQATTANEASENTQASGSMVNPDTGIPSPRASTAYGGHPVDPAPPPTSSGVANPVKVVREVGSSAAGVGLSPGNIRQGRKYDPSSYQGRCCCLTAQKLQKLSQYVSGHFPCSSVCKVAVLRLLSNLNKTPFGFIYLKTQFYFFLRSLQM